MISLGETVAPPGCDFFATGVALRPGLSSGLGEASAFALADGLGVSSGSGVGEAFFLCFPPGEGEGELFGFGVGVGVSDGSGVGLFFADAFFFFGDELGEGSGVDFFFGEGLGEDSSEGVFFFFGDADGDANGVGVGDDFFLVEAFRFFGGGVGSNKRLILVPKSSSPVATRTVPPVISAQAMTTETAILLAREINEQVLGGRLCSNESRHRDFRAGSSR